MSLFSFLFFLYFVFHAFHLEANWVTLYNRIQTGVAALGGVFHSVLSCTFFFEERSNILAFQILAFWGCVGIQFLDIGTRSPWVALVCFPGLFGLVFVLCFFEGPFRRLSLASVVLQRSSLCVADTAFPAGLGDQHPACLRDLNVLIVLKSWLLVHL